MILTCDFVFLLMLQSKALDKETDDSKKTITETIVKEDNDYKNDNFVFLGDSITDWYPIEELYEDELPIINSGKAGYRTDDILDKLDDMVYKYNPSKVFILIGTNDLNSVDTKEETISNIKEIISNIKNRRKDTEIYYETILPINKSDDEKINKKTVGKRENKDIIEINEEIKKYCAEENVTYIDLYNEFINEDGDLKLKYTEDGLHMSSLGYLKMTKIITPYLEEK